MTDCTPHAAPHAVRHVPGIARRLHHAAHVVATGCGKPLALAAALAGAGAAGAGVGVWQRGWGYAGYPAGGGVAAAAPGVLRDVLRVSPEQTASGLYASGLAVDGSSTLIPGLGIIAFASSPTPERTDVPEPGSLWVFGAAVGMVAVGRRWAR